MSDVWTGIAYPWDNTLKGTFDPKDDSDVLKSSIINIVMTRHRERVMLPEFGSSIADALFEPNTGMTVEKVESSVREALALWEDRIRVMAVSVEFHEHTMRCAVTFRNSKDPLDSNPKVAAFEIGPGGELL